MYQPDTNDTLKHVTQLELIKCVIDREAALTDRPIEDHNGNTVESILRRFRDDPSGEMPKIKRGNTFLQPGTDLELNLEDFDIFITRAASYEHTEKLI